MKVQVNTKLRQLFLMWCFRPRMCCFGYIPHCVLNCFPRQGDTERQESGLRYQGDQFSCWLSLEEPCTSYDPEQDMDESKEFVFFVCFCVWDRFSLSRPVCPVTHSTDQVVSEICLSLPLPPQCWDDRYALPPTSWYLYCHRHCHLSNS